MSPATAEATTTIVPFRPRPKTDLEKRAAIEFAPMPGAAEMTATKFVNISRGWSTAVSIAAVMSGKPKSELVASVEALARDGMLEMVGEDIAAALVVYRATVDLLEGALARIEVCECALAVRAAH